MSGEWPSPTEATNPRSTRGGKVRACAECRRLKLRCDRNFPCQACIRRGCSALCPDKCFTDEATPRSLKANNLKNREEIQQLREKVSTLEAALAAASTSSDATGSLYVSTDAVNKKPESDVGIEDTLNVFGSLSVEDEGAVFHGDTSMSENFMKKTTDSFSQRTRIGGEEPSLPTILTLLSALFPFAPRSISDSADFSDLLVYLPSPQDALEVSDIFWYTFSHGITPIIRPFFISKIYDYFYPPPHIRRNFTKKDAHKLGLLYIYIALGLLADERQPMLSTEAEKYYQLARASLSLDPICDHPTLHGLQCMMALSWYLRCTPNRGTPGYRWCLDGVTLKLASMMGIFRNSRNWLTDPDDIEQREALCWELVGQEVWQAFTVGRPCSIDVTLIDCPKPPDDLDIYGGLPGFVRGGWKHRFYPILYQVLRLIQQPRPVKYGEIIKLERELRQAPLPEKLVMKPFSVPHDGLPDDDQIVGVQRFGSMLLRETICCLLHRRFLVMAMENGPQDPRKHPFWYSAYQAGCGASWIIKCHIAMYRRQPALVSRVPAFWSASFSAAIMLGAMAARYWNYDFAKGSLEKFESICALFKEASETSLQPANALELLEKLQNRVRERFMHPEREFNLRELPLGRTTAPPKTSYSKSSPSPAAFTDAGSDFSSSSSVATPDQYHSPATTTMTTPMSQMTPLKMTPLTMTTTHSPEYMGAGSMTSPTSPSSAAGVSPQVATLSPLTAHPPPPPLPPLPPQHAVLDWKMPVFSNLPMFPQSTDGFDPRQLWGNAQAYGSYTPDSSGHSPGAYEQAMLMDVQTVQTDPWDRFLNNTLG